jgi:hypothetical protein
LFRARLAAKTKAERLLRKQQIMLLSIKSTLVDRKIADSEPHSRLIEPERHASS